MNILVKAYTLGRSSQKKQRRDLRFAVELRVGLREPVPVLEELQRLEGQGLPARVDGRVLRPVREVPG